MLELTPVEATDLSGCELSLFYQAQGMAEKQADHKVRRMAEWMTEETFGAADPWSWISAETMQYLPMDALIRLGDFCGERMRASDIGSFNMLASAEAAFFLDRVTFAAYYAEYRKAAREAERWGELQVLTWRARRRHDEEGN